MCSLEVQSAEPGATDHALPYDFEIEWNLGEDVGLNSLIKETKLENLISLSHSTELGGGGGGSNIKYFNINL